MLGVPQCQQMLTRKEVAQGHLPFPCHQPYTGPEGGRWKSWDEQRQPGGQTTACPFPTFSPMWKPCAVSLGGHSTTTNQPCPARPSLLGRELGLAPTTLSPAPAPPAHPSLPGTSLVLEQDQSLQRLAGSPHTAHVSVLSTATSPHPDRPLLRHQCHPPQSPKAGKSHTHRDLCPQEAGTSKGLSNSQ